MYKVFVNINDCKPGMTIAQAVFNEYGVVIVAEDVILDEYIINKLIKHGIEKVRIYSEIDEPVIADTPGVFKEKYNEGVGVVKELLHDISIGNDISIEKVNHVTDSIHARLNENRDIIRCLNEIRGIDDYTYTHCMNVSLLSMLIGKWMKLSPNQIKDLVQAGLLHDIGKSKVPKEIINKPSTLSTSEFDEIKKHPVYGYRILTQMSEINGDISKGVLMHHEREDGSGYPMGLKGPQIHLYAKIIAVADVYDAMTHTRVYRDKESPFEVFYMMENGVFGYMDPIVINAFLNNMAAYYIGDSVRISSGEIGEIIYINPRRISQPLLKVGDRYIDLTVDTKLKIIELC